jgi:prepilin-type N-terminal cleavage/methylation domain-containing protein
MAGSSRQRDVDPTSPNKGFTLVEMSIVLVIISLLIGGIILGRDLISSAAARAQVAQIDKLKTALNTFKMKYSALPGDLGPGKAAAFGMLTRAGTTFNGDENGLVRAGNAPALYGETQLFWTDLSSAGLLEQTFAVPAATQISADTNPATFVPMVDRYLPRTSISLGHVYAYSNRPTADIQNYAGVTFELLSVAYTQAGAIRAQPLLPPSQAYYIDSKLDDGMPETGTILSATPGQPGSNPVPGGATVVSGVEGTSSGYCVNSASTPNPYNLAFPNERSCNLLVAAEK